MGWRWCMYETGHEANAVTRTPRDQNRHAPETKQPERKVPLPESWVRPGMLVFLYPHWRGSAEEDLEPRTPEEWGSR